MQVGGGIDLSPIINSSRGILMKLFKLMAAASVGALLAGAANAQLALEQDDAGSATISAPYSIAEEVDFAVAGPAGDLDAIFGLEVLTQGVIPPGQNIFLTIQIQNGVLDANLDGSEFGGGITGAVVDAGGTIGDNSVRYLITTDTIDLSTGDASRDGVVLDLPVQMSSCGDLTFSVTEFETESGSTPIEGGSAALAAPAVTCDEAFVTNVAVDVDNTVLSFLTGFTTFVVSAPDTATNAILGDFDFAVDTTVNVDLAATAADPAMVLGFASDIDFLDATGIVDGEAVPAGGDTLFDAGPTAIAGTTIPLVNSISPTNATETGTFELNIDGINPVSAQAVTVSNAEIDLDDATYSLQATDPFNSADVEDLRLNGQYFGPFDWVSDSTALVNTIFRITGLDSAGPDIPAQVIVQNSRNGNNGVFPFTLLASDVQGSEVRLNSQALENIVGSSFRTGDISLVFSTDLDLDVDRLLAGPSQAVVVPFGDGANQDGSGGTVPTTPPTSTNDDEGNF